MTGRPRRAERADAPVIAAIHAASSDRPWSASEFAALLADRVVFAFLEEAQGRPCGFVMARAAAGESEILTLATEPSCRRRGIASRLLSAVIDEAARRGAKDLFLEVSSANDAARALYIRHGFAERGRRTGYYGVGPAGDAVILARPLQAAVDASPVDS